MSGWNEPEEGNQPRRRLPRSIPLILTCLVLVLFVSFLVRNVAYIREQFSFRPTLVFAILGLTLLVFSVRAAMNQVVFRLMGVCATFRDWFGLVTTTTLANYLPLSGGLLAKGIFLKRVYAVPYRIYAGGQITLLLLIFCSNGIVGLVTLGVWMEGPEKWIVWALYFMMALSGTLLGFPKVLVRLLGRKRFPWPTASGEQRTLTWVGGAVCQFGILCLQAAKLYLCFSLGGRPVTFAACIVFSAATVLTRLVSVTPGSIGIREFLIGALAHLCGFGLRDAVIASTIDRVAEVLVVGSVGSFFTLLLSRRVVVAGHENDPPNRGANVHER